VEWDYQGTGKVYVCFANASAGDNPSNSSFWREVLPFVRKFSRVFDNYGNSRGEGAYIDTILGLWSDDPRTNEKAQKISWDPSIDDVLINADEYPSYVWVQHRLSPPRLLTTPSTIPYRFSDYCAFRSAAAMAAVDGKLDLAKILEDQAEECLSQECDKINSQESYVSKITVSR
jgi:hypothetical protein